MSDMDEDYDFEYEDEEEEEDDEEIEVQNIFYSAKGEDNPKVAISEFEKVLKIQGKEKTEWGFKALKQIVKLHVKLGNKDQMIARYKELLSYTKSAVTRNQSEKVINSIIEFMTAQPKQNSEQLEEFYELTLESLNDTKNDRLWFKTNLKLAKLYLQQEEFGKLSKTLRALEKTCQNDDGTIDFKKGTQLLEVYALEIQMYTATKNHKKLKELYHKTLIIKSAIPHPQIMGVIRECGGKMHMREKEWTKAYTDFYEAFKSFEEAGSSRRIACLKCLVLANMLAVITMDPFDYIPEAKPYKKDPEIVAMSELVKAYDSKDTKRFETILKENKATIMEDPFIRDYIQDLLTSLRSQALKNLLLPYTRIKLPYLATELGITTTEVESLLVTLILDFQIRGRIDQVNQLLILEHTREKNQDLHQAAAKFATQLSSIQQTMHTLVS